MIQSLIRNKTVMAAISIITGIYLMIARRNATSTLVQMIGYALFAMAIAYLVLYFMERKNGTQQDQVKLGYACGAAVLGLLVRLLAPLILNLFPVLLGIAIVIAGISNLKGAKDLNSPKAAWIGPILTIVLGAVIAFHPGAVLSTVIFLAGVAMVINGLSELDLIRRIW